MCLDIETQAKINNSSTILDEILSNQRSPKDKTILGYEGMSEKIYKGNQGSIPKQQNTFHKRSDIP